MPQRPRRHRPAGWKPPDQAARDYDRWRGSAASRGYDYQWQKYSKGYRIEHPLCIRHWELFGRVVPTFQVDHVIRHKGQEDPLFWDPSNHQPLCQVCGAIKSALEGSGLQFDRENPYPDRSYGDRM